MEVHKKFGSTRLICDECIDVLGLGVPSAYDLAREKSLIHLGAWEEPPVRDIPASDFCDKCAKVLKQYGIDSIQHGDVADRFHF